MFNSWFVRTVSFSFMVPSSGRPRYRSTRIRCGEIADGEVIEEVCALCFHTSTIIEQSRI